VFVGEILCGTILYQAGKDVYDIKCGNGVVGDYVKVVQNNNYLTLAEVQSFGVAAPNVGGNHPLIKASGFTASQSSTGFGGVPSRAIDGNTSGKYSDDSCSHSGGNKNNWWMVNFNKAYKIYSVKIFNRNDCCQDRIDGANVSLMI